MTPQPHQPPRVLAITVAWNCREAILRGIEALESQINATPPDILVIDNASNDGTAESVSESYPHAEVVKLPVNTGGAGGFAHGMSLARDRGYDFAWLVDGDARVAPDALAEMLAEARAHPHTGAFAATIIRDDGSGLIQECGGLIQQNGRPRFLAAGEPDCQSRSSRAVDYGAACSLFVRVDAIRMVGVFDPGLFVFFDDIDWCLRLRRAGWDVRTAPRSKAWHPWHGTKPMLPWRAYYGTRNQIIVPSRHCLWPKSLLLSFLWLWWACRWERRWRCAGANHIASAIAQAVHDALAGRLGTGPGSLSTSGGPVPVPDAPPTIGDSIAALGMALSRWMCTRR